MKPMRIALLSVLLLSADAAAQDASPVHETSCDCTTYPFKPKSCYKECVAKLAEGSVLEIDQVKNIDPGVALSIRVFQNNKSAYNAQLLMDVNNKRDLERAALETQRLIEKID